MKILGIINKDSAVAYHRITMPLVLMKDVRVHVTNNISEETFNEGFDIVLYSRITSDYAFDKLNEMREKHGFKLFCDVDDYWKLDYWHPMREEYEKENFERTQIKHIINADGVFVTNERLYNEVIGIGYNEKCYIIPNAIPLVDQFIETEIKPDDKDKVRLFWQGSITHEMDINMLRYVVENIANTMNDKVKMVMAGWHDGDDIWLRIAKTYTKNGKLSHALLSAMTFQTYYKAYSYADVCLVPLVKSRFNSMKSNLKILEAANIALPCIAHFVDPYKDLPVIYALGTVEWVKAIKYYVNNKNARIEDGLRLKEYCSIHYDHSLFCELRKQIFEYEYAKQGSA